MNPDDELYDEVRDVVDQAVRKIVDRFPSDPERSLAAVQAGKALIMLGCTYVGNAGRLDAKSAIDTGTHCLERLKDLIRIKTLRN